MKPKRVLIILFIILAAVAGYFLFRRAPQEKQFDIANITAEEVKKEIANNEDIVLLDVRTQPEFNGPLGHIEGTLLIPLQELQNRVAELDSLKNKKIIVYCRSGNRSRYATEYLSQEGFNAVNMLGGMKAWNKLK